MARVLRILTVIRDAVLAQSKIFLALFVALSVYAWVINYKYPLGPGQDYHYHLMTSAIHGRPAGDPLKSLYVSINPLDSNTLIYTLSYPFEKVLGPVHAFQVMVTIFYYIGFPLACAVALRRVGRPPWGALLAFPLAYYKDWSANGYMTFLSAAPFFVLAIAEFHLAHTTTGKRARNSAIACSVCCFLTFLAHGHVFVWLALLLAMMTLVFMAKRLGGAATDPRTPALAPIGTGILSLAVIAPGLLAFLRWYVATHHGPNAANHTSLDIVNTPWLDRIFTIIALLSPALGEPDSMHIVYLGLVVLSCLFLARRTLRSRSGLTFELCVVVTLLSYFVLPSTFGGGQTVAIRHFSFALWLLPLVLFEADSPGRRLPETIAIALMTAFTVVRLQYLTEQLKKLNQEEFAGLIPLARECARTLPPNARGKELAYAAMTRTSKYWRDSWSYHQAHETFAAICGLDTPVYDTSVYPHNFIPLRYRGPLPAPITILSGDRTWYRNPTLWTKFQYVLVQGWTASRAETEKLIPQAEFVGQSGDYQLWRTK